MVERTATVASIAALASMTWYVASFGSEVAPGIPVGGAPAHHDILEALGAIGFPGVPGGLVLALSRPLRGFGGLVTLATILAVGLGSDTTAVERPQLFTVSIAAVPASLLVATSIARTVSRPPTGRARCHAGDASSAASVASGPRPVPSRRLRTEYGTSARLSRRRRREIMP